MNENNPSHFPGQQPEAGPPLERPITLCPADAAALDSFLDQAPILDHERHARVGAWLGVLGKCTVTPASSDLVERTLAAIQKTPKFVPAPALPLSTTPLRALPFGSYLTEWVAMAVAASLVIAVLIPGITSARQDAQRVNCSANLASFGRAFATYATNHNNDLPNLGKTQDGVWMPHDLQASTGHSNTANLLPLVRHGYLTKKNMACPGRGVVAASFDPQQNEIPDTIRGYSYINLFGPSHNKWNQENSRIVLADRNPLFDPENPRNPKANSNNHNRLGTNVLASAQNVEWVKNPNVGPRGTNIWTIDNGKTIDYKGHETPTDPQIVFLAP